MKLLFLLVFAPVCLAFCPENHFKDDISNKCLKCTPCHVKLTPCTANKDAVCEYFNDKTNHHFLKNRIHFLDDMVDDSLDEEFHDGDFFTHKKDHHKKNGKHLKSKHEDKHHHKKKHYEFDDDNDDESSDNYNDDFNFKFEKVEKPKKHKKHFEFSKQKGNVKHYNKKADDFLSDEDLDDEDFIFGKDFKKNKKKTSHPKKIDVNEEELEELLLQSKKQLKIQKDKFLKTLKDEKESSDKHNKLKSSKNKKSSQSDALKALADLNSNDNMDDENDDDEDYEDDLDSLLNKSEESYKPEPSHVKINEKLSSQVIGQGEAVNQMLRSEMGKNVIYEKPHFKIIPYVVGKDFDTKVKNSFSQKYHPPPQKKHTTFNKENDSEEYREIESNEVVSLPFTAAETLVWDWQAVAVASAVASCLVFFLVVAIYFIVNTRHWKKVNKHYNKELISELDDISTRIALMQPMLELGSPNSRTSIYMENSVLPPPKEDEKKGDIKV